MRCCDLNKANVRFYRKSGAGFGFLAFLHSRFGRLVILLPERFAFGGIEMSARYSALRPCIFVPRDCSYCVIDLRGIQSDGP